jgi:hypothetical protein
VSGSAATPSKRAASGMIFERYAIRSSCMEAAFRSVSSVMWVALIHSAVEART